MFNEIKFKQALVGASMNNKQFAQYLGINRETLRRIVHRGKFTLDQIYKMIDLFGKDVCMGFLFDEEIA